jgi:hypothetical protein
VRGKAGIFLQRTPTESIFKFPVLIFRTPAGSSQPGVGGGGDHQRSLIPARGVGTDLPTQNNLSTCKPSPSLMWAGGGGGLIWAAVGRPEQSDGPFSLTFQLPKEITPTIT